MGESEDRIGHKDAEGTEAAQRGSDVVEGAVDANAFEAVTWGELAQRGYPVPEAHEQDQSEPAYVTVATTRPETYLGDTAVGVSPKDRRAKDRLGRLAYVRSGLRGLRDGTVGAEITVDGRMWYSGPASCMTRPTIPCAPRYRRCHSSWLIRTTRSLPGR